jgi:hypothetical protein
MLIITNKMQRNTTFFIAVKALHVSGGFPARDQKLSVKQHPRHSAHISPPDSPASQL